ncbi:thioredoxin family protein [Methanospirillum sp.]|uniref:thioredoxin family protein n=1 Tax=Methanospirillum sp. TaxID=45200 RepID=UPI00298726DE|nr:thioredoxin family protein [Methanospirillum sp.]
MKIEIFGSGCTKCRRMYDNVVEAVKKTGADADIIKVDSLADIISRGVMMTPSLFVDGKEVVSGRVPGVNEIVDLINEN